MSRELAATVDLTRATEQFWGKARPIGETGPRWHPLAWHMLDVAGRAHAVLDVRVGARLAACRT